MPVLDCFTFAILSQSLGHWLKLGPRARKSEKYFHLSEKDFREWRTPQRSPRLRGAMLYTIQKRECRKATRRCSDDAVTHNERIGNREKESQEWQTGVLSANKARVLSCVRARFDPERVNAMRVLIFQRCELA